MVLITHAVRRSDRHLLRTGGLGWGLRPDDHPEYIRQIPFLSGNWSLVWKKGILSYYLLISIHRICIMVELKVAQSSLSNRAGTLSQRCTEVDIAQSSPKLKPNQNNEQSPHLPSTDRGKADVHAAELSVAS